MSIDATTLYELLNVDAHASIEEIRKSYKELALRHHPDKQSDAVDSSLFISIQHAYHTLSNPASRAEYDASLRQQQVIIDREIDLDDMRCETDQQNNIWYCCECRCGSVFRIAEASLLSGSDIYQCQTCCLGVRILFAEVE